MILRFTLAAILTLSLSVGLSQNGSIKGVITDGRDSTNKPIFGAMVFIEGTTYGSFTGQDGSFVMENVSPGKYDVTVSYVLIGNQIVENVKVEAGQEASMDYAMNDPEAETAEVFILTLTKEEDSEETTVAEMRDADEVKESQSNDEMSKRGSTTLASATKSITGVSIVEGKYAYIRGLSDRYTKTVLNGSEIPGLDPDRNAVQLDLFPSSFVASMDVVKTFSPNLPGDFSGGLINIKTRESYDSLTFKIGGSLAYNPQVHLKSNFLTHNGGSFDWLGFDDGTRAFSPQIEEAIENNDFPSDIAPTQTQVDELVDFNSSMNGDMTYRNRTAPLDQSLTFSMGNTITKQAKKDTTQEREYGYFFGTSYKRSYSFFDDGFVGRYELENQNSIDSLEDPMLRLREMTYREGKMNVLVGGLFGGYVRLNPKNKISYRVTHNHTGQKKTQYTTGYNREVDNAETRIRVLGFLHRRVNTFQMSGEHFIDTLMFKSPTKFNWTASYSNSSQAQPDLRVLIDDVSGSTGSETYSISTNYTQPSRFRRYMTQHMADFKTHFIKEIKTDSNTYKVKAGLGGLMKYRNFGESIIQYRESANSFNYADYNGDIDAYFADQNFNVVDTTSTGLQLVGLYLDNNSSPNNLYTSFQGLGSGYLMGELPLSKKLVFIGGARAELNMMNVETQSGVTGDINELSILPSANFTYTFYKNRFLYTSEDSSTFAKRTMKMKAIWYNTVARPSFREFSPLFLNDFLTGWNVKGNPDIRQSSIQNFDLRWEYYPQIGEIVAVSAFYKIFTDGIEKAINPGTVDVEGTWKNNDGFVYGLEAEYRRGLGFISDKLSNFKVGVNAAIMQSQTNISDEEIANIRGFNQYYGDSRAFFGQSPFLVNGILSYENDSLGINVNVTYNQFGKRLAFVSSDGVPNIFEQGRKELNFNISKKLNDRSKITFRAKNLFNPKYEWRYEFRGEGYENAEHYELWQDNEYVFKSYRRGRRFSVSYSYTF